MKRTKPLKSDPDKIRAWKQRSAKPMKRSTLRKVSKKRQTEGREYSTLRKFYLADHPTCKVCQTEPSCDIHHTEGRGRYYLAIGTFLAVCRTCHQRIHDDPKWAEERGYLKRNRNTRTTDQSHV